MAFQTDNFTELYMPLPSFQFPFQIVHFISALSKKHYDCKAYINRFLWLFSIAKKKGTHFIYVVFL